MAKDSDWRNLEHAYGSAEDLPQLLAGLSRDANAEVWGELWSRVCHQGTVYSASFPVLPYLLDTAAQWSTAERVMPLALAAAIVASDDVKGSRAELMAELSETVRRLEILTSRALEAVELSRVDRICLLEAKLAFSGSRVWGRLLHGLADGEFGGQCPHCSADLYLVIGDEGYFAAAEEWVNRPECRRSPLSPSEPDDLPKVGIYLHETCLKVGDAELGLRVRYLFGSTTCPSCASRIRVSESITGQPEH